MTRYMRWLAAERAYLAAERSGDPLLAGISDFRLTHVFLSAGRSAQAQRVATVAAKALETSAGPDSAPELRSSARTRKTWRHWRRSAWRDTSMRSTSWRQ